MNSGGRPAVIRRTAAGHSLSRRSGGGATSNAARGGGRLGLALAADSCGWRSWPWRYDDPALYGYCGCL